MAEDSGDATTSDPLDAEAVKQEIYSENATWIKNDDGSFFIDIDNDGVMDYLALVVGSYIYVNDIEMGIEEIGIIYEPDDSYQDFDQEIEQEDDYDEDVANDSEKEENGDDKIHGQYISPSVIERDGLPAIGENVYKEYYHKP